MPTYRVKDLEARKAYLEKEIATHAEVKADGREHDLSRSRNTKNKKMLTQIKYILKRAGSNQEVTIPEVVRV